MNGFMGHMFSVYSKYNNHISGVLNCIPRWQKKLLWNYPVCSWSA